MDRSAGEGRPSENWEHAGRLLRGAAHEVNNQLGAILAYADLIALSPGCSTDVAAMAKEIATAVRSGAAHIDTIAALVSDDLTTVESINLAATLPRVSNLFRFELDRTGSGIDLDLPAGECVFLGVRARIVRALTHAIRFAAGSVAPATQSVRVRIRLIEVPGGCAIEIDGREILAANAASLEVAREHLAFHRGTITCVPPRSLRIEIPSKTGLKRS